MPGSQAPLHNQSTRPSQAATFTVWLWPSSAAVSMAGSLDWTARHRPDLPLSIRSTSSWASRRSSEIPHSPLRPGFTTGGF
jgi:hypothetical protein